jgi:hypothetical protein
MHLEGANQDGVVTSATFDIAPGGCGSTPGYYWVGNVSVKLTDSSLGAPDWPFGSCEVPKEQEDEVFTCRV